MTYNATQHNATTSKIRKALIDLQALSAAQACPLQAVVTLTQGDLQYLKEVLAAYKTNQLQSY
jgi:hypothetical protein